MLWQLLGKMQAICHLNTKKLLPLLLPLFFLTGGAPSLQAQDADTVQAAQTIWPLIESRLEQTKNDSTYQFIFDLVRKKCGKDFDCLYQNYRHVMNKLENRYDLLAAIYVGEEMAAIARQAGDPEREAQAYRNLGRFHGALGNSQLTTVNLEKALRLFEQAGKESNVIYTKVAILEHSLSYREEEEVIDEIEALLERSVAMRDTTMIVNLHVRLIHLTQHAGLFDKMDKHVAALESIPISDPLKPSHYGIAIHAALGRANLLKLEKKYDEAVRFYQKTLRLCEEEPSRWVEIHVLLSLAGLEWERGRASSAKAYLDKAQPKAEALKLHELLSEIFERKGNIAEAESRFADALAFFKKQKFHREKYEERSAGFDLQNYYLQKEKDQLAIEKRNQELELQLKKAQLRNSFILIGLVVILVAGLAIAFYHQRQGRKELARQNALILRQAEQLKNLDLAKSRFFANISHELRTPLALVLGPIRTLMKDEKLSEKQIKLLQAAGQSGKQLQHLVNEILDLRKLEMGKMELQETPTAITPFFGNYAAQFESLAHRKQIDFSFETALPEALTANIDREKCRQILYNLLSNAFKFTPQGGKIRVELGMRDEERGISCTDFSGRDEHVTTPSSLIPHPSSLVISVSDTGPGIHPDDLPHVFDRFFQTSRPDKPAEGGTGIGLALCQEYAKLFGGKIEVESEMGKGTTFRVAFPVQVAEGATPVPLSPQPDSLAPAPAVGLAEKKVPQTAPASAKPTILVVEDNPGLQDYIRLILEEKYHIVTAENGQVALQWLMGYPGPESRQPTANCQLILSDLMMPVMDGYQLLEKLKSSDATRHLPVIMLTARAEARDKLKALRIGVDDYLTKPFDEEELLVRIENLLKNKAARQAETQVETGGEEEDAPAISETDQDWLASFEAYVQQHIGDDTLSVPLLAQHFAMSESTLLRQLKRLTGLTPQKYLQEMRLDLARQILEENIFDSVAKVASEVGYGDTRSFSRSFRQRFGKLPSEFLSN